MIIVVRSLLAHIFAILLITLLWWLLSPANAHASGKAAVEALSYPTVAAIFSAVLLAAKTIEQLLSKAGLLRSEQEKQIDKIYNWLLDSRRSGSSMIEDLHAWHKPIETPSGTRFLWRDSGEHKRHDENMLKEIEGMTMAVGKLALQINHSQDLVLAIVERLDKKEQDKHQ